METNEITNYNYYKIVCEQTIDELSEYMTAISMIKVFCRLNCLSDDNKLKQIMQTINDLEKERK